MQWQPKELVNGSPVLFRVTSGIKLDPERDSLHGTWLDRPLSFRFGKGCNCWYAIAGVDLDTRPGQYPLRIQPGPNDNPGPAIIVNVKVREKQYPLSTVTLPPAYVQPPPEVRARIEEEEALKKKLFAEILPEALWSGRFRSPVVSGISGGFGAIRVVNGVKGRPHQGTDYHAAAGTTVRASNRGKVLLARGLYYEGNCVAVDHGQGLVSIYMHLSSIKVKEGQQVERGQILGLSGTTGRSTGPHLHFAVRWQGVYIDPKTLLAIIPPQ